MAFISASCRGDLLPGVGGLRGEVFPVEMEGLEPLPDLAQFAFVPFDVLPEAVDPEFRQVELGTEPEELLVPLGDQGCGSFSGSSCSSWSSAWSALDLFGELGDFAPVAQEAPVAAPLPLPPVRMPLGLMMSPSGVTKVPQKPFCRQREMPFTRFGISRTSPSSSLTIAR